MTFLGEQKNGAAPLLCVLLVSIIHISNTTCYYISTTANTPLSTMGNTASTSCLCLREDDVVNSSQESLDPLVNSRSSSKGQLHLMWKKGRPPSSSSSAGMEERFQDQHVHLPTRLVIRKSPNNTTTEHHHEHQPVSTHIYAVRKMEEQRPYEPELTMETPPEEKEHHLVLSPAELFTPAAMAPTPSMTSTYLS